MEQAEATETGWRKRHPVASRVLLYGLGALLVVAVLLLLQQRRRADAQDRFDYLTARLDALDVVLATGGGPEEVLKVIDAEFPDEETPASLRHRALRLQAQALARLERYDQALASLREAADDLEDATQGAALGVERAEMLGRSGRIQEALALLREGDRNPDWTVELWRRRVEAWLLGEQRDLHGATEVLEQALATLPRPAPPSAPVLIGGSPQTLARAILQTTEQLCLLQECDAAIWRRLVAQLPTDPAALALAAAKLESLGREAEAAELRARLGSPR